MTEETSLPAESFGTDSVAVVTVGVGTGFKVAALVTVNRELSNRAAVTLGRWKEGQNIGDMSYGSS